MNPCKSPHKYRYSVQWAQIIVAQLLEKYARATEILFASASINTKEIVHFLATGSKDYPVARDCIKYVDRWLNKATESDIEAKIRWYTTHLYSAQMPLFDEMMQNGKNFLLTDFREWLRLNSQGFKGGKGGPHTSSSSSYSGRPKDYYTR